MGLALNKISSYITGMMSLLPRKDYSKNVIFYMFKKNHLDSEDNTIIKVSMFRKIYKVATLIERKDNQKNRN